MQIGSVRSDVRLVYCRGGAWGGKGGTHLWRENRFWLISQKSDTPHPTRIVFFPSSCLGYFEGFPYFSKSMHRCVRMLTHAPPANRAIRRHGMMALPRDSPGQFLCGIQWATFPPPSPTPDLLLHFPLSRGQKKTSICETKGIATRHSVCRACVSIPESDNNIAQPYSSLQPWHPLAPHSISL